MMSYIDGLIGTCSGGATVDGAAKEMYEIGQRYGLPVSVVYNDRLYKIELVYTHVGVMRKEKKLSEQ